MHIPGVIETNKDIWKRFPSNLFLSSLFIWKECKYNVQQRHSTKQWRAEEMKLLSEEEEEEEEEGAVQRGEGQVLRVNQRPSNQTSAPGVSASVCN